MLLPSRVRRQFFFYILSFVILVYYASQIVVLFKQNAVKDILLVRVAFKSVHLITGMVIMLPILLLSFLPLFVDLQTRMLFNEDFSQRWARHPFCVQHVFYQCTRAVGQDVVVWGFMYIAHPSLRTYYRVWTE